jgi:hypothetical protein
MFAFTLSGVALPALADAARFAGGSTKMRPSVGADTLDLFH